MAKLAPLLLSLSLAACAGAPAAPTRPASAPGATAGAYETARAKILKTYAAEHEGYRFVAYLVEWRGDKIVVSDPLGASRLRTGEEAQFVASRFHMNAAAGDIDTLSFSLAFSQYPKPVAKPAQAQATGARGGYETLQAEILDIHRCRDGKHRFVAYEILWKGNRVIVSDPLARGDFKVGDTLSCMMNTFHSDAGTRTVDALTFTLLSPAKPPTR